MAVNVHSGADAAIALARLWLENNPDHVMALSDIANGYGSVRRKVVGDQLRSSDVMKCLAPTWAFLYGDRINKIILTLPSGELCILNMYEGVLQGCVFAACAFTSTGNKSRDYINTKYGHANTTTTATDTATTTTTTSTTTTTTTTTSTTTNDNDEDDTTTTSASQPAASTTSVTRDALFDEYIDDQKFLGETSTVVNMMIDSISADMLQGKKPCTKKLVIASHSRATLNSPEWNRLLTFMATALNVDESDVGLVRAYLGTDGNDGEGTKFLGCPFGNVAYRQKYVRAKVARAKECVYAIESMKIQERFQLLRFCITSKLDYHARNNDPEVTKDAFDDFDDFLVGKDGRLWLWLEEATTLLTPTMYNQVRESIWAPISSGGLGIRSAARVAEYAHASALGDVLQTTYADAAGMELMLKQQFVQEGGDIGNGGKCSGLLSPPQAATPTTTTYSGTLNTTTKLHNILTHLNDNYSGSPPPLIDPQLPQPANLPQPADQPDTDETPIPVPAPFAKNVADFLNNHKTQFIRCREQESNQKRVGKHVSTFHLRRMIQTLTEPHQVLRMYSQMQKGAMRAIVEMPTSTQLSMSDDEFRFTARECVGLAPEPRMKHLDANIPCLCGAKIYDTWHVRQCMECGARRHTHDKQVDVMYNFACDMLPGATVLSDAMLAGYFDDVIDGKHPDLLINLNDGTKPVVIDYTTAEISINFLGPLGAAKAGEARKNRNKDYLRCAKKHGLEYYGVSMEPSGAPGPGMKRWLKWILKQSTIAQQQQDDDDDARGNTPRRGAPQYHDDVDPVKAMDDFTKDPLNIREQDHSTWQQPTRFQYWLAYLSINLARARYKQINSILHHNERVLQAAMLPRGNEDRLTMDLEHHIFRLRKQVLKHIMEGQSGPPLAPRLIPLKDAIKQEVATAYNETRQTMEDFFAKAFLKRHADTSNALDRHAHLHNLQQAYTVPSSPTETADTDVKPNPSAPPPATSFTPSTPITTDTTATAATAEEPTLTLHDLSPGQETRSPSPPHASPPSDSAAAFTVGGRCGSSSPPSSLRSRTNEVERGDGTNSNLPKFIEQATSLIYDAVGYSREDGMPSTTDTTGPKADD